MTPQEIAALPVGPELDRTVARLVFGAEKPDGNTPKYSKDAAWRIFEQTELPIRLGRISRRDPNYTDARPFYAEDTTPPTAKGMFPLRVIAATPQVALCKLACIYMVHNKLVK